MLRHRIGSFALVAGLSAGAFAGCSDDASNSSSGPDPDAAVRDGLCQNEGDCDPGQVCFNGACVLGECSPTLACAAGRTCNLDNLSCVIDQGGGCTDHPDCQGAGFCIDGQCQPVACVEDTHCNPGEECTDQNRCVPALQECIDADGDTFGAGCQAGPDCDDANGDVHPGQTENGETRCDDGIDHDCANGDAVCGEVDADGDGVTDKNGDCDDADPQVNPDKDEVYYNGKDDDCDPQTRDDDQDGDGFRATEAGGDDCNDQARHINPGARDVAGNGTDEDCDGSDRVAMEGDVDGDGVTEAEGDCNDENPAVSPNAEETPYNGVDDDCDVTTRDNDLDADGFPAPADCGDEDPAVNPNAREVFGNGVDDDCDPATVDADADGDGFGGGDGPDCNDSAPEVNPDADEVPYNGVDDDCDPATRDDDLDNDGAGRDTDCDEDDPSIHPGVTENGQENCGDGIDHDCRGGDVECGVADDDADDDGVPDAQDCEPNDPAIPGPVEIVNNGRDDDCDPATPDACADDAFDRARSNGTDAFATGVEDGNTGGVQYGGLVVCPNDDDWYQIDLRAGDGLEIDLAFEHDRGDVDVALYKRDADGELVYVDSSTGVGDTETVYERRASENATYLVRVYGFRAARNEYGLTANVFTQCTDDAEGGAGEHNDTRDGASRLPAVGERRQVCDHDDDWYTFDVPARGNVRIDLLFAHDAGDVDMQLFRDGSNNAIAFANSSDDDETIEQVLERGTYHVRVYGFNGAKNAYRLFKTSGQAQSRRVNMPGADVNIPDYANGAAGVARVNLVFDVPAGAVIRRLTVRDLDVNHDFLRDLRVIGMWEGQDVVVMWDREGDENGGDGGRDDDFLPLTGGDINFDDRVYRQFEGLAARGTFTLRVEDHGPRDTGAVADLSVEIEYLLP